jgi:hypothetical protein
MTIEKFLSEITHIKRAPWKLGKAPHKPLLLLAVKNSHLSTYA